MLHGETDTFPTNDSPGHFTTRSGRQWPHESFRLLTYNCIDIPFKFSGESVLFLPQTNMHMHISKGKCMCCCDDSQDRNYVTILYNKCVSM